MAEASPDAPAGPTAPEMHPSTPLATTAQFDHAFTAVDPFASADHQLTNRASDAAIAQGSQAPSLSDEAERPVTPLPHPHAPFMSNRQSVISNMDSNPSMRNSVLGPSSSLNHLDPSKLETQDKPDSQYEDDSLKRASRRSSCFLATLGAGVVLVIVAVALGVYFGVTHHHKSNSSSASSSGSHPSPSASSGPQSHSGVVYGGDGTVVTTDQGTTFVYNNSFGGYFVTDSNNPFTYAARAQSYTPPLNQSWQWGVDKIMG
jgi:hypothetical protein